MKRVTADRLPRVRRLCRDEIEARAQSSAIREAAERQARATIAEAEREAIQIRERAFSEGISRANAAAAATVLRANTRLAESETLELDRLVTIAAEIVRTILAREAASSPAVLRDVARQALRRVRARTRVAFRVHPDDVTWARRVFDEAAPAQSALELIEVFADMGVERGGLIIESELGTIDARLAFQVEALRKALVETP